MSYSSSQIVLGVQHGRVNLGADTAGYLVLAAAEQLEAGASLDDPCITLESSGAVTVGRADRGGRPAPTVLSETLGALLDHSSGDAARLRESVAAGRDSLSALVGGLRAALLPLNRSAARRALMRLHRQVHELEPTELEPCAAKVATVTATPAPPQPRELPTARSHDPTPTLGSLGTEPRVRAPRPLESWERRGETTGVQWTAAVPGEGSPDELTAPFELAEGERTVPEPAAPLEREPGLGRVLPKKSDVAALLSSFHVPEGVDESELLRVLEASVAGQGTPFPPAVAVTSGSNRSR